MNLISFLAGAAVGALLTRAMAPTGSAPGRSMARSPADAAGSSSTDVSDQPTHTPVNTDEALHARIASQMGRTLRNPEAIQVYVNDGAVTLRGQVHAHDVVLLMAELGAMAGVKSVDNQANLVGSMDAIAPPHGQPAARAAERETSHMS